MRYVDIAFESPVVLSLCTGMRGLERGLERAGVQPRVAAFVEIEAFICENLVQQMEQGLLAPAPVWTDLKTFPWGEFCGKIHGITGGYPCQPFSHAGKRGGSDDPRHLWPYILEGVRAVRPVWCFFENVSGHLSLGYREVREDLLQLGYAVEEGIFSAAEVGAPHQRKRLFILAVDNTYCQRLKQEYQVHARGDSLEYAGEGSMVNTQSAGDKRGLQGLQGEDGEITGPQEQHEDQRGKSFDASKDGEGIFLENPSSQRGRMGNNVGEERRRSLQVEGSSPVANSEEFRIQRDRPQREQVTDIPTGETISGCDRGADRWPAGPGEEQFEWEPPRVESRVGYVLNGHNFREDLLRMAGNAVVEQTAELAWVTLMEKMFKK